MSDTFPEPEVFLAERPLYALEAFEGAGVWKVIDLLYFNGTYDSYCTKCRRDATFKANAPERPDGFKRNVRLERAMGTGTSLPPKVPLDTYRVRAICTRDNSHHQDFFFLVDIRVKRLEDGKEAREYYVQKVGQQPSFGDLHLEAVKKYRTSLPAQQLRELSQAIGLASHDVGIGSFVYLRRVFEWLVEEAHQAASRGEPWDEAAYAKSRMSERIAALHDYLPAFLVEHPQMYSLLSKGVHELTESECLANFPTLRIAIELILDERHEKKLRAKKIAEANEALSRAVSKGA